MTVNALILRSDGRLVMRRARGSARPSDTEATAELVASLIGGSLRPDDVREALAKHQMNAHIERRGQGTHVAVLDAAGLLRPDRDQGAGR